MYHSSCSRMSQKGTAAPSNDRYRRCCAMAALGRTRTDCQPSQFDPTRKVEPLRSSRSTTTIQARKIIDVADRGPSSAAPPCGVGCSDWLGHKLSGKEQQDSDYFVLGSSAGLT